MANLSSFSVFSNEPVLGFWGGDHTAATDPTRQGWRCRAVKGQYDLWLVGRRGQPGSASIRHLGDSKLDVSIFVLDPASAARLLEAGQTPDCDCVLLYAYSGVGLKVIREILRRVG